MRQFVIFIACVSAFTAFAADSKKLLTEAAFQRAINEPLSAHFDDMELGSLLEMLGEQRQIVFQLDRRTDPTRHVSWRMGGEPLLDAVDDRLSAEHASARAVGATIFVGPEESLKKLRTIIALRKDELDRGKPATRQQLVRGSQIRWAEAATPQEVLRDVATRWKVRVDGIDDVPYDLWPAGLLHDVNFMEALSVVLIQYDRTFQWNAAFDGVKIVPMPEKVWIEKRHEVPATKRDTLVNDVDGILKSIDHTLERDRLMVRASIEDHERVQTLLGQRPGKSTPVKGLGPLKSRVFSLTGEKVRIGDALQALKEQGIVVRYDESTFQKAGIDFEKRVDLKLNKATADQLLTALCEPLGVSYSISGITVTLSLKK